MVPVPLGQAIQSLGLLGPSLVVQAKHDTNLNDTNAMIPISYQS